MSSPFIDQDKELAEFFTDVEHLRQALLCGKYHAGCTAASIRGRYMARIFRGKRSAC